MSQEKKFGEEVFADTLNASPHGKAGKLFQLEGNPDVVIRREKIDISTPEKLVEAKEKILQNQKLFADLETIDGMRVAKELDYRINENEDGEGECFRVIEAIAGTNLKQMEIIDEEAGAKIDECFAHYLGHILRVLEEGGSYWSDMHNEQIVYGTRAGETELHAYVVDLDPFTRRWMLDEERKMDPGQAKSVVQGVLNDLKGYWSAILFLEVKLEKKGTLFAARAKFKEILSLLSPIIGSLRVDFLTSKFDIMSERASKIERKSVAEIRALRWS